MRSNLVRAVLACAALALAATPALAVNNPIPGIDVVVKKHPGGNSITATTDADGRITLKGLAPGDYEIDIDGNTLSAAMDKLAPPPAPEKKESHSSFSLGIGGGMFGGGSHHSSSGGKQGAGPVQGAGPQGGGSRGGGGSHGSSSGGGGLGLGLSIPLGGEKSDDRAFQFNPAWAGAGISIRLGDDGPTFSSETPLCPDSAKQGIRIGFTVPKGAPADITMSIFDRWGNLSAVDDSNTTMQDVSTTR